MFFAVQKHILCSIYRIGYINFKLPIPGINDCKSCTAVINY